MSQKGYKYFDHPSDIGIQCQGATLNELFNNAVKAIYNLMIGNSFLGKKINKNISLQADNIQDLFSLWISEIIFYAHAHRIFFNKFEFKILTNTNLQAKAHGHKINKEIKLKGEVKAMTYHNYFIKNENNIWIANFIVDV